MFEKIKTVTSKKEVTVEVTVIVRYRLVVIPVAFVGGVAVAIVQVVNMVAVGNRNVAAALTVLVVVVRMLVMFSALALVPVAFVLTVDVAIVEVVGVVAVWECDVAAALAVGVCVVFVDGVCHGFYSLWVVRLLRVFNLFPLNNAFISISIRRPKLFQNFFFSDARGVGEV